VAYCGLLHYAVGIALGFILGGDFNLCKFIFVQAKLAAYFLNDDMGNDVAKGFIHIGPIIQYRAR